MIQLLSEFLLQLLTSLGMLETWYFLGIVGALAALKYVVKMESGIGWTVAWGAATFLLAWLFFNPNEPGTLRFNPLALTILVTGLIALKQIVKLDNILGWMAAWWVGILVFLQLALVPPPPVSVVAMFMLITTISLAAYMTTDTEAMHAARDWLGRFLTAREYTPWLGLTILAIPTLVAYSVYADMASQPQPPALIRTVHPQPPKTIKFKGKTFDMQTADNPYRPLKESDPESFSAHVENGRRVYYQNCIYCHGDNMGGDGQFAHGLNPLPASFNDPTTIAMLQESYLFWRVAKGAPGLPNESTPWASAMPAWENFLSEEEIWDVILFMYEFTGYKPRAREDHGQGGDHAE